MRAVGLIPFTPCERGKRYSAARTRLLDLLVLLLPGAWSRSPAGTKKRDVPVWRHRRFSEGSRRWVPFWLSGTRWQVGPAEG